MNSSGLSMSQPAAQPLVEARGIHKSYASGKRDLKVLRGVNFSATRGEFVALQGASGAGKSTLLHLLGGLDLPNAGEIFFDGQNLEIVTQTDHGDTYGLGRHFGQPSVGVLSPDKSLR